VKVNETVRRKNARARRFFAALAILAVVALGGCASRWGLSAEEYFAIGMAYFEIAQNSTSNRERYFSEAEKWLGRASARDRTMSASTYNLGRLHFEAGRFAEAAERFESILVLDPENVLALRAAAYARIRNGEIERAAELYERFLALVPESADDGYNHALVLFAMSRYEDAEQVLRRNEFALNENADFLLLLARAQSRQDRPEAIDSYADWLVQNPQDAAAARVRFEFAEVLQRHELYARALEEFRLAHDALSPTAVDPSGAEVRFAISRVLFLADPGNAEGMTELKGAVEDGFRDFDAIEGLLENARLSERSKAEIRAIVADGRRAAEPDSTRADDAAVGED
jgi:tetratricopeptide (TPR) repeat protein